MVQLKHGYDTAGNRLYRLNEKSTTHSQLYQYDQLHRLDLFKQGTLSGANNDTISSPTQEQTWTLDRTGNWKDFTQQTPALTQQRVHNAANEIDVDNDHSNAPGASITASSGTNWADPKHDAAGNMTTMPQPKTLASSYTSIYDAWNRLVEAKDGTTVAEYEYDGLNRRITKVISSVTRHFYYSTASQVLEEREGTETNADIQYIWGTRYVDDLILRDRDADNNGTSLEERLYALQDANWNIVAITDTAGNVQQRFEYDPYGSMTKLTDIFGTSSTNYEWEYTYTGRRLDDETGLMYYRARYYHTELGRFIGRDPIGYDGSPFNLHEYVGGNPTNWTDPSGLGCWTDCKNAQHDIYWKSAGDCLFAVGIVGTTAGGVCLAGCIGSGPGYAPCVTGCFGSIGVVAGATGSCCMVKYIAQMTGAFIGCKLGCWLYAD